MFWVFGIFKEYLDFQFLASGGRLHVRVVERPGLWMSSEELSQTVSHLRTVVNAAGIPSLEYGVVTGEKDRLDRSIMTLISDRKTGKPVAFNALAVMDCTLRGEPLDVVHLGLVVVDPTYRAKGMSWLLYGFTTFILFVRNQFKPYWVSNVTQVPAIVGMVADATDQTFPSPAPQARRSYEHLVLARQIMARHRHAFGVAGDAGFDEERFVITNAYTGGSDNLKKTFEQAPKHRSPAYNEMCERELDYARGDDFLQLGIVNLKTLVTYLLHTVPKSGLITVSMQAFYVLAESMILPVLRWLSPQQAMGDIRPWKPL